MEPNQEIQLDFAGPIFNERGKEKYILTAIDRFSKFPTTKIVVATSTFNVTKFLNKYINLHGVPRTIRTDQGTCFTSNTFVKYCKDLNIEQLFSPVDDHRATGQVERIIRVLKERLTCMKNDDNHKFNLKHDCAEITAALRLVRNRNTGIVPFEMHFGRPPNTVLKYSL